MSLRSVSLSVRRVASRSTHGPLLFGFLIIVLAGWPSSPLQAENGRDFSAMYDFRDVVPVDAQHVSVRLALQIQNHSGADVYAARLTLRDGLLEFKTLGEFEPLTLAYHQVQRLSQVFTVSPQELQRWQSGQPPRLMVEYQDAVGRRVMRPVELMRDRVVGERP